MLLWLKPQHVSAKQQEAEAGESEDEECGGGLINNEQGPLTQEQRSWCARPQQGKHR